MDPKTIYFYRYLSSVSGCINFLGVGSIKTMCEFKFLSSTSGPQELRSMFCLSGPFVTFLRVRI